MRGTRSPLHRAAWWLPPLAHAALIAWSSSLTSHQIPSLIGRVWDKLLHGGAYGLLAFLVLLALMGGLRRPRNLAIPCAAVAATMAFGLIDEWHQSLVATRVASATDLLADLLGSLAAVPVFHWISGRRGRGDS
jgi:VanZ family protein